MNKVHPGRATSLKDQNYQVPFRFILLSFLSSQTKTPQHQPSHNRAHTLFATIQLACRPSNRAITFNIEVNIFFFLSVSILLLTIQTTKTTKNSEYLLLPGYLLPQLACLLANGLHIQSEETSCILQETRENDREKP